MQMTGQILIQLSIVLVLSIASGQELLRIEEDLEAILGSGEGPTDGAYACQPTDLLFMLDTSGSIKQIFDQQKALAVKLIQKLPIEEGYVRIGTIQYAGYPVLNFALNTYTLIPDIQAHISRMIFLSGVTRTASAFRLASRILLREGYGGRPDAHKIIILMTDGLSFDNPIPLAKRLREEYDVTIYVLSLAPDAFPPELTAIAGKLNNVIYRRDIPAFFETLIKSIRQKACSITTPPPVESTTITTKEPTQKTTSTTTTKPETEITEIVEGSGEETNESAIISDPDTQGNIMNTTDDSLIWILTTDAPAIPEQVNFTEEELLLNGSLATTLGPVDNTTVSINTQPPITSTDSSAMTNSTEMTNDTSTTSGDLVNATSSAPVENVTSSINMTESANITASETDSGIQVSARVDVAPSVQPDIWRRPYTNCAPLDILFVVDSSGSLELQYRRQIGFIREVVDLLKIGPRGQRVGIIQFAGKRRQRVEYPFAYGQSRKSLLWTLGRMKLMQGTTAIGSALEYAASMIVGRSHRPETWVVILTDGYTQDDAADAAKFLRSDPKNTIYAVGMGERNDRVYLREVTGNNARVFIGNEAELFKRLVRRRLRNCYP